MRDLGGAEATIAAYRAWAQRSGGQGQGLDGDPSWSPQRRFDRAFERLSLPGLTRGPRFAFLELVGALGLAELEPASLHVGGDARDPVAIAAKRVFGIGDVVLLERRASELAAACEVSPAVLERALRAWGDGSGERSEAQVDGDFEAHARAALGVPAPSLDDDA